MIQNNHNAKFVVFEGIDGSGKSDQYDRIRNFMNSNFPEVVVKYSKEPDVNRPTGKSIYDILNRKHPEYDLKKMRSYHMQAFYIEDRMCNYRENIIPSLQNKIHVFQDRGMASSFCYGAKRPDEFYDMMGLHDRVFSAAKVPLIWPDLILIFDVPVEASLKRMRTGGKKLDQFETLRVLKRARKNYLSFAKIHSNCVVIDGTPKEEKVFTQTKTHLLACLGLEQ